MQKTIINRLLALVFALIGCYTSANGQCACADIRFQITVTDSLVKNGQLNYSIKVLKAISRHGDGTLSPHSVNTTTTDVGVLKFSFPTGAGIDTLVIVLKNLTSGEEMSVTTIGLHYDVPYHIDLLKFTQGSYLFDWTKIDSCMKTQSAKKRLDQIIECDGRKFTRIYTDANSYYPSSIKPLDLKYFAFQ